MGLTPSFDNDLDYNNSKGDSETMMKVVAMTMMVTMLTMMTMKFILTIGTENITKMGITI